MKQIVLAIAILILSLAPVGAKSLPPSILENQLTLIGESLQLNQQRQEDYRRQGRHVPDFLIKEEQRLQEKREQIEKQLRR